MNKNILLFAFLLSFGFSTAQNITSKKWSDLFSYNNVLAIKEDNGKLLAATENGLFYYNLSNGEISKLSKANGLHEVKISAFDYDQTSKIGLIGYESGAMDILTPNGITYVVDIPIAQGFTGDKRINHISITGNLAVLSTNYGISIFNLTDQEFNDSTFFVNGGSFDVANEAIINNNAVYVATVNGIMTHEMNVTFPVYSTWTNFLAGNFTNADIDSGEMVFSTNNNVFLEIGGSFTSLTQGFTNIQDVVVSGQNILITDTSRIYNYGLGGNLTDSYSFGAECNTANLIGGQVYGGTKTNGVKNTTGNIFKPDGPYSNTSYKMSKLGDEIWVSSGGRASFNGAVYRDLGYYHFNGQNWIYPEYFIDNPINFNVLDVMANPSNPSQVYFTNYSFLPNEKGIYKMENNSFVKVYGSDTGQFSNRLVGIGFDSNSNLFITSYLLEGLSLNNGYYLYNPNSDSFDLIPVIAAGGTQRPLLVDGFILIPAPYYGNGGVIMKKYDNDPSNLNAPVKILRTENNLPANGTVSLAIDKNDDIWIGTRAGLRILPDYQSSFDDLSPQTESIVIEQNGIAEELFRDSNILQIAVDSGNQKWISIDGGGVYYLSPNGENTILHFTEENSPLPTNSATDIYVDEKTGKVYFVTLDGIVVYQGDVAEVSSNFGNVVVYPNPVVRENFKGNVTIKGLAERTNIRITDAAGNLVHQAVARGGFYQWDLNNQKGRRVASGIYFVLMTNDDGSDKATAKIAVVN